MSANRDTMVATISSAGKTALDSKTTAQQAAMVAIQAVGPVVGYKPGDPTGNATYVAGVQAAAKALADARAAAEMAKISTINVAKDLLRSQGETP